jgi:hypothetical protein
MGSIFVLLALLCVAVPALAAHPETGNAAPAVVAVPASGTPPNALLVIERGPCFGTCPVDTMTVLDDGAVSYEGKRFVVLLGRFQKRLDEHQVVALRAAFDEADFMGLRDVYDNRTVTDLPATSLFYRDRGGATKYVQARVNVPEAVTHVVQRIYAIVGWTDFQPVQ